MLHDARRLPPGQVLESDLCIVGAGAAGLTLARTLGGRGLKIHVLESGGLELDEPTQALYQGEVTGNGQLPVEYLRSSRLRYYGGSTNHWTGMCRALDAIDFEPRPWVPHSGWPFRKSELVPFYARAAEVCELPGFPADASLGANPRGGGFLCAPGAAARNALFHMSPPTRFAARYGPELGAAPDVEVFLHANAVELATTENGAAVESVEVRTLEGRASRFEARAFVLAGGGVENARLLLASRGVQGEGIGNQHDLVGRFFMEHLHQRAGFLTFHGRDAGDRDPGAAWDELLGNSPGTRGVLSVSEDVQRRLELLNFSVEAYDLTSQAAQGFVSDVARVALDLDRPGMRPRFRPHHCLLFTRSEQSPNPASRVTLARERDALGMPRVRLEWRLQPRDLDSIRRSVEVIGGFLGEVGLGRAAATVETGEGGYEAGGGNHHMGTTRMHADPRQGVVDADGRVHSTENLYVAGSSVFPTVGFSNPTLTIVALSLRLAEHLARRLEAA